MDIVQKISKGIPQFMKHKTLHKAKIRKSKIIYPLLYTQQLLTHSRVPEKSPNINIRFNHKQA